MRGTKTGVLTRGKGLGRTPPLSGTTPSLLCLLLRDCHMSKNGKCSGIRRSYLDTLELTILSSKNQLAENF